MMGRNLESSLLLSIFATLVEPKLGSELSLRGKLKEERKKE